MLTTRALRYFVVSLSLIASALSLPARAQEAYVLGTHYEAVEPPQPTQTGDKIEVLELFWYGCPHCFEFEPYVKKWLESKADDVAFRRMPAVFAENWMPAAKAYYVEEMLGVEGSVHSALFNAIHVDKRSWRTEEQLQQIFAEAGVAEKDFSSAWESSENDIRVKKAVALTQSYAITGVPALIVAGKYRVAAGKLKSYEEMLKVADFLVDKERTARKGN